jgi:hypothetical protein
MRLNKKRIAVLIKRYLNQKKDVLTPKQRKMISIVRKTVNNPKSSLTVDPMTGTCYSECNEYYIILTIRNIDIYGKLNDYVDIDYTIGEKLVKFFYSKVSERRVAKETIYKNRTISKLDEIYAEVSKVDKNGDGSVFNDLLMDKLKNKIKEK